MVCVICYMTYNCKGNDYILSDEDSVGPNPNNEQSYSKEIKKYKNSSAD